MMVLCKKTYTLQVVVQEGNDEFWEGIRKANKTGCDEVVQGIANAVSMGFPNALVRLIRFAEEPPIDMDMS